MEKVKELVNDIKKGQLKPIYFLMGEEPYYIDKISDFIESTVLTDIEKEFNQVVLYGKDIEVGDIVASAKRFPMMAERQVVIVKEAQNLSRSIGDLEQYAKNPQPTTVLVINYKYKTLDKRKTIYKALNKTGVVFESKKLYENQIGDWLRRVLSPSGYKIDPKAAQMLVEFLGTDLSKISNELDKLKLVIPKGSLITPELIEQHIGISKDFNNFELTKAIGKLDKIKAYQIVNYFAENPKDNPMVVTMAWLFTYFSKILQLHGLGHVSPKVAASALKVNPFFVNDYIVAARNFPMRRVSQIISTLRVFDGKSKGVGANAVPQRDLLLELMVSIFG